MFLLTQSQSPSMSEVKDLAQFRWSHLQKEWFWWEPTMGTTPLFIATKSAQYHKKPPRINDFSHARWRIFYYCVNPPYLFWLVEVVCGEWWEGEGFVDAQFFPEQEEVSGLLCLPQPLKLFQLPLVLKDQVIALGPPSTKILLSPEVRQVWPLAQFYSVCFIG